MSIKLIHKILNFIFVPKCINCKNNTDINSLLCKECFSLLGFVHERQCKVCGFILQDNISDVCVNCSISGPSFSGFINAFDYGDTNIKNLIYKFKYGDNTTLVKFFGDILFFKLADSDFFENIDYIIPVPMHYVKLIGRKYNQSSLLAKYLAKKVELPFFSNILIKHKRTKPQASLSLEKRLSNVKGSFKVKENKKNLIKNKNILLIDDIVTTGNTINECSSELKKGGAEKVFVLSIARVDGSLKIRGK